MLWLGNLIEQRGRRGREKKLPKRIKSKAKRAVSEKPLFA